MDKLKMTALALGVCVLCFFAGKYLSPPKIETREVEKIVYREHTDTSRTVDKRETIKPDGTRVIETQTQTNRTTNKELDKQTDKQTVTTNRPNWHITATYSPAYNGNVQTYGLDIQKRMFSEVYIGAFVTSQKTIGISVGFGF